MDANSSKEIELKIIEFQAKLDNNIVTSEIINNYNAGVIAAKKIKTRVTKFSNNDLSNK